MTISPLRVMILSDFHFCRSHPYGQNCCESYVQLLCCVLKTLLLHSRQTCLAPRTFLPLFPSWSLGLGRNGDNIDVSFRTEHIVVSHSLHLDKVWGFVLVAVLCTGKKRRRKEKKVLLMRVQNIHSPWPWYGTWHVLSLVKCAFSPIKKVIDSLSGIVATIKPVGLSCLLVITVSHSATQNWITLT